MSTHTLSLAASALLGIALFGAASQLARVRPVPRPAFGMRGLMRARALERRAGFALFEPLLRFTAALLRQVPCERTRARLDALIERAGHPSGLCADEVLALCVSVAPGAACAVAALGLAPIASALAAGFGAAAPVLDLHGRARGRQRQIAQRLPAAIDLLAMCMDAGLDFTAALERVVRELGAGRDDALCLELRRVLHELGMGRTRSRVLSELAERVPTPALRDFAHAVIQAELQGSPLASVLEIQAVVLRQRRSIAAEEAAARASVLFMLPLLLLLAAILLLLFGPFLVNGAGL